METRADDSNVKGSEPIGFVGLGAMGAPMARHLARLGYRLLVHDLNLRAVQSVVDCGARALPSARLIASEAKLVFTCLPSLDALREVVLGKEGLQAGEAIETYVDLSTTGSQFARELAAGLSPHTILMLDAPITGNVTTAGNGTLGIMCSGPAAAFRHAEPIMRDLASTALLYLGEQTGRAQTLKLLNNVLSATGMAASCEAFILGVKAGLDPQKMLEVINSGEASSSATRNKFSRSVLPRRFDFGARMAITAKDISLTVKEAEDLGVPMWVAQTVQQIWKFAASQGGAERDGTSLITYLEPWAGVEVRVRDEDATLRTANVEPRHRISDVVILCDARLRAALARRLQEKAWTVAMTEDGACEQDGDGEMRQRNGLALEDRCCRLVGVESDSDVRKFVLTLKPVASGARMIINAHLMRSAEAAGIARVVTGQGGAYLDALLTGSTRDIEAGNTSIVAGGSEIAYEQARPLLEAIGSRVFHVSESPGLAHVMQLINGSLFGVLLAVTCEAFVVGAKAGLNPLIMTKIMGIETGRNAASARIIPEQVATRKFDHGKRIEEVCRELTLLSDEARELGATPWILDKARLLYGLAARLGHPDDDVTRLITHYEKWAGVEVVAGVP